MALRFAFGILCEDKPLCTQVNSAFMFGQGGKASDPLRCLILLLLPKLRCNCNGCGCCFGVDKGTAGLLLPVILLGVGVVGGAGDDGKEFDSGVF